jgi:protein-L-isoaspartate(D-aspartate) O-methyltransferase
LDSGNVGAAYKRDRRRLVEGLRASGIDELAVLHAFDTVPRHMFVPDVIRHRAYEDAALPIGHGQTISRPGVHAIHLTLAELEGTERVLEIGTGSGFQTALLAALAREVYSVEAVAELGRQARDRLEAVSASNVTLWVGDGSSGWPEHAPYDVILVGAAAPKVPEALAEQLALGGRLIIPVGEKGDQRLLRVVRTADGLVEETVDNARFVPLVGEEGW